jgi:hypothetical protein
MRLAARVGRISLRNPPHVNLSFGAIRYAHPPYKKHLPPPFICTLKHMLCEPISMRLPEHYFLHAVFARHKILIFSLFLKRLGFLKYSPRRAD